MFVTGACWVALNTSGSGWPVALGLVLAALGIALHWWAQDEVLRATAASGFASAFWFTLVVGILRWSAVPTPSWFGKEPLLSALLAGWLFGYAIALRKLR